MRLLADLRTEAVLNIDDDITVSCDVLQRTFAVSAPRISQEMVRSSRLSPVLYMFHCGTSMAGVSLTAQTQLQRS